MNASSSARSWSDTSGIAQSSRRSAGRWRRSVTRARCSALLTAATGMSSASPTSAAGQSSISRSISTARWRGGSSWMTAMNASSIVSRPTSAASGSSSGGATSSSSRSG
jgi:hypothetical protein